jgi:hypothetical protein
MDPKGFLAREGWRLAATVAFLTALSDRQPGAWNRTAALWIVSWILLVAAARPGTGEGVRTRRGMALLCGLLLAAGVLPRLIGLDLLPQDVHGDEANVGLAALAVRGDPRRPLFGLGWCALPNLGLWLQGVGMDLAGQDLFGLRLGAVFFGVGSLAGHALLAWSLFGPRIALLSLAPLTAYHWHVHLSRTGESYIQATFFVTWSMALYARARQTGSCRCFALSGLATALGCLTYPAARITPIVLGALALTEAIWDRRAFVMLRRGWTWMGGAFLIALAPALPLILGGWDLYMSATPDVVLWSPRNREQMHQLLGTDRLAEVLWIQVVRTFGVFLYGNDSGQQYGFVGRYVDPLLAGFAVLGLALCVRRVRDWRHGLLLLWFGLTLVLGCVLCVDAPFLPHASPVATLPYLFSAIGLEASIRAVGRSLRPRAVPLAWCGVAILSVGSGLWNLDAYFRDYVRQRPAGQVTVLARRLAALDPGVRIRMLTAPRLGWDYGTIQFLAPGLSGIDVRRLEAELEHSAAGPRVFVLFEDQTAELARLRSAFPHGAVLGERSEAGFVLFRVPGGSR